MFLYKNTYKRWDILDLIYHLFCIAKYKHGKDRAVLDGYYFVRGSRDDFIQLSILPSM